MSAEKQHHQIMYKKKLTKATFFKKTNKHNISFSFINKIIYQPNFHVVEYVNFEQQEKPIYEHIDIHQVLELYQAN
jgi:hypothetical protein